MLEDHLLASYKNQDLTVFERFDQNNIYIDGYFDVRHSWLETSKISICVCDDMVMFWMGCSKGKFWNT